MAVVPKTVLQKYTVAALILIGGFAAGWFSHIAPPPQMPVISVVRETSPEYSFTSPLLFVGIPENESEPEYVDLKKKITSYISATTKKTPAIADVSVYYRNLTTNTWFGINADDTYSPASMLKVGTLVAFLRKAESDPTLLNRNIHINENSIDTTSKQDLHPPVNPIKVGGTYPVSQLLESMIIDSDNNAAQIIGILTGDAAVQKTYDDLHIYSTASSTDYRTSPRIYSRLFRALYNATYLSHSVSEKVLGLLSKTTFDQGIVAGVPKGTIVSHKFGERTLDDSTNTQQHELHDCGIVYYPKNPYLLCIMTKGAVEFPVLEGILKDVSTTVWSNVPKKTVTN